MQSESKKLKSLNEFMRRRWRCREPSSESLANSAILRKTFEGVPFVVFMACSQKN